MIAGASFGMLGVAIGAFGAHALKPTLLANNTLETYELAVRYQFYHAFALLVVGLLMEKIDGKLLGYASTCMVTGVLLFSGSLLALAFQVGRWVVFATPIGGVFFIAAWTLMIMAIVQQNKKA